MEEVSKLYFKEVKGFSEDFKELVDTKIKEGIDTIIKYGAIPTNYKHMGNSPRLMPLNYGQSINNTKKILRAETYKRFVFNLIRIT